MNFIEKFLKLYSIIRPYKWSAVFLLGVMLACALSETLGLGMIMPLLAVITNSSDTSSGYMRYLSPVLEYFPDYYRLMVIGGLFVLLILIKNILFALRVALSARFVYRFRRLWTCGIMEKYMYAEYPFLLSQKQGVLLNNMIREPGSAAKSLQLLIEFSSKVTLLLFLYGLLLLANWQITLVMTLIAVIVMIITGKTTYNYSMGVGQKKIKLGQQLTALGAENISGNRQIKIFSLERRICEKFSKKVNHLVHVLIKFYTIHHLPKAVTESLVVIGIVSILVYLHYISRVPLGEILPILGLFIVVSQRFFPTVSELYSQRMNILTFIPSLKLVHELYTSTIKSEELNKGKIIDHLKGDIVFKEVHFSYDGSMPLFKGLNLRIPKGKMTAIVGPSGSGKSTIVDLLVVFFKKQKGQILIDGIDLDEINPRSWRSLVGYVSQDTFLFNTTVKENILLGKPDASEEEILAAARRAHADEFIRQLPQGYETTLGDRGLKISGGQRQRISIARAIIRNPELLIFDEAMNAVDSESEKLIQESINELAREKTIIIISHRLSTVKDADIIYFVENGQIVESGTFEELKNKKGRFHKMRVA